MNTYLIKAYLGLMLGIATAISGFFYTNLYYCAIAPGVVAIYFTIISIRSVFFENSNEKMKHSTLKFYILVIIIVFINLCHAIPAIKALLVK